MSAETMPPPLRSSGSRAATPRLLALVALAPLSLACASSSKAAPAQPDASGAATEPGAGGPGEGPASPSAPVPGPATEPDTIDEVRWLHAEDPEGRYRLAWRPVAAGGHGSRDERGDPGGPAASVPRNVECELELRLHRDGAPCPGADLSIRGWMPNHRHGLVREPQVAEVGEGRYLARGFLLHMRGAWTVYFDVLDGEGVCTLSTDLEL